MRSLKELKNITDITCMPCNEWFGDEIDDNTGRLFYALYSSNDLKIVFGIIKKNDTFKVFIPVMDFSIWTDLKHRYGTGSMRPDLQKALDKTNELLKDVKALKEAIETVNKNILNVIKL